LNGVKPIFERFKLPGLFVESGPNKGAQYPVVPDTILGRKRTCSVVIDDALVSREHTRIFQEGAVYYVEDLGSSNGTYLNEVQIRKTSLTSGDRIRIGDTVLTFIADPQQNLQGKPTGDSQIQEEQAEKAIEAVHKASLAAPLRGREKQKRASPIRSAVWFFLFLAFLVILFFASAFATRLVLDITEK
jgi:pSer/pThr/pTyr-binding forkhead associated (FHA) protein